MRAFVLEGTPEEIGKALNALGPVAGLANVVAPAPAVAAIPDDDYEESDEDEERQFVSVEIARRVLSRRPLSREQRRVLLDIYAAGPDDVLATVLQDNIKYSKAQFAGLMGALGRRLVNTKGYVDNTWFVDNRWDDELACNRYRLPESVREAMRLEGLVK